MLTACVLMWKAWCRHVRLNLTIRRPRLRWPDCVSWRRLQPTHPLFAQNVIPSTVRGSLISSCLFYQHYLCVVLPSLPAFVSTTCVWYSHHFLPLLALPVCGTPISSFLCQQCLCVVLSSVPFFVSSVCVWFSHQFVSLSAVSVCGSLISSFLCQQCLCVVLSSVPFFVSSVCVWYSHQFLSLSAVSVCGTLITSSLCQHYLCVVLPSLPAFVINHYLCVVLSSLPPLCFVCLFVFSTAWGLLTKATFFSVCSPTIYLHLPCP